MLSPSFYADDNASASHSNAGTAVSSATERFSSDNKMIVPSPAESQPEAASTTMFSLPTQPNLVPRQSLSIENEKADWVGAFAHIKTLTMSFIRSGDMQKKQFSFKPKDDLSKVLTKKQRSQILRQGCLMTEDEASSAKIESCIKRRLGMYG